MNVAMVSFQEFIDQLITAILGELLIYIIGLLFMSAIGGIVFAAICFSWGILFLLLPFAVMIYILVKNIVVNAVILSSF